MKKPGKFRFEFFILTFLFTGILNGKQIYIGTASADITPDLPVALEGQFNLRIADSVETPLTANVIVLESREDNISLGIVVMVSCDLLQIPVAFLEQVRSDVKLQLPWFNVSNIFLNAIHTHTAPLVENDSTATFRYALPETVTTVDEYREFFARQVSAAIVKAWKTRKPGSVSWGLSHAVIGYNRRVVYSEPQDPTGSFPGGNTEMYGNTNSHDFRNLEGTEDHDVNVLFFWNGADTPAAMAIDIPCPAQEVEGRSAVNADYWYPVRERLKQKYGQDLCVVAWIGAAGDQSPHPVYRQAAEERMMTLRHTDHLQEISGRIVTAVEEAYNTVRDDRHSDAILIHQVHDITLPLREVTEKEYVYSKSIADSDALRIEEDPDTAKDLLAELSWNAGVVDRYEKQKSGFSTGYNAEIHIIRIGDVAICTSPFELFTDYGLRIQARSKALQTFVVELAGDGSYLPTARAVEGGGYSAVIQSDIVSPEGGQQLVDKTVESINGMF
jgi:hypothetical protein